MSIYPDAPKGVSKIPILATMFFLPGQVLFRQEDPTTKKVTTKPISPAALRAAVLGLDLDTGWLPNAMHLMRWGLNGKNNYTYVYLEPRMAVLYFSAGGKRPEALTVPLPGLIFKAQRHSYSIWAVRTLNGPDGQPMPTHVDGQTELYNAPFPNVSHSGLICWGANRYYDPTPANMTKAWSMFLRSPFTGSNAANQVEHSKGDVRKLWRRLAKTHATVFPNDELVANEHTLEQTFLVQSHPGWPGGGH